MRQPESRFKIQFQGRSLQGRYLVKRVLAEGGMGTLYLAMDTNLGRTVVVKAPHLSLLASAGMVFTSYKKIDCEASSIKSRISSMRVIS